MDGRELKAYERFKEQAQFYRGHAYHLEAELRGINPRLYHAYERISRLKNRVRKLAAENAMLRQRVKDLTAKIKAAPAAGLAPPAFVKANLPPRRHQKPGRKSGHPAALRPRKIQRG